VFADEEVDVRRVALQYQRPRQFLGQFPRPFGIPFDEPRLEPFGLEEPRRLVADLGAADDNDLFGVLEARFRRQGARELADVLNGTDNDGGVASLDDRLTVRDDDVVVAQQRREGQRLEAVGLGDRLTGNRTVGPTSNSAIWTRPSANVSTS